jgi:exopolysaccharide production protein ExoZ
VKLRSVQVLRGVAACAVVSVHAFGSVGAFRLGAAGVDLFFVISGFIIATIAGKRSPGEFLVDRLWRIFPLWLIAVLPWLLFQASDGPTILASLTLWPIYDRFTMPALGVGWSLSFELLFYLATALALLTRPLVPLALFAVALVLTFTTGHPLFDLLGNPMIFEFLFGVAVAQLPRLERYGLPVLGIAILALILSPKWIFPVQLAINAEASAVRVLYWGLPCAAVLYGSLCLEKRFKDGPLVLVGDASYSIYLVHMGVITLAFLPPLAEFVLAVWAGIAIHFVVERPLMGWWKACKSMSARSAGAMRSSLRSARSS